MIKQATRNDTQAIVSLFESVWPDEQMNPARLSAVLDDPTHLTLVYEAHQQLVGFVDAFETRGAKGSRRWEVDLIAVKSTHQGQSIGRQLISAAKEGGIQRGCNRTRALIACNNLASQRAFAHCGYHSDGKVYDLYICSKQRDDAHFSPHEATLIPVSTLRYQGAWIEERWTTESLTTAQHLRQQNGWQIVGAVIPRALPESMQAAKEAGFERIGQYSWWEYEESKACFGASDAIRHTPYAIRHTPYAIRHR